MKIGILTFHWSRNYGAALQAYGLKTYLHNKGKSVEFINYKPSLKKKKDSFLSKIKGIILTKLLFMDAYQIRKQKKLFYLFQNEFLDGSNVQYNSREKIDGRYDLIVCGSDQIWNPKLTGGRLDKAYFGILPNCQYNIAISYAASIGEKHIPQESIKDFKEYVKNLKMISVREQQSISEIGKYTETEVVDSIDPTLLLGRKDYEKILNPVDVKKPYLLIYQNTKNPEIYRIAEYISKREKLDIVEITYRRQVSGPKRRQVMNAGPKEFLGWYRDASYIVTNTFHGTVFSIIFEKNYVSIPLKGREDRVLNLSNKLLLNNRLISRFDEVEIEKIVNTKIDYKLVKERIIIERDRAAEYIDRAIGAI